MQPIQEVWISEGDSLTLRILGDWFVVSRGTLLLHVGIPGEGGERPAILRQHGGESLLFEMLGQVGDMDSLPGTCWSLERQEDGSWFVPNRRPELEEDGDD